MFLENIIDSTPCFFGFLIFITAVAVFHYLMNRTKGLGEFSVGISHRDLYAFVLIQVPLTAAMAYLAMAFGQGLIYVSGNPVYWIRYFEWALTTPILILGLMILTQRSDLTKGMMVSTFYMIVFGFFSAITTSILSLVFFGIAGFFFFLLLYGVVSSTEIVVHERPKPVANIYKRMRNIVIVIWSAYPFVYLLGQRGIGVMTFNQINFAFLVLDVLAKVGFASVIIYSMNRVKSFELDTGIE